MNSLEQQYYEWDGFWEPEYFTTAEVVRRFTATVNLIPQDVRTLADIGCGSGEFGRHVLRSRPAMGVLSVDRSSAALKRVTTEKALGSVDSIPLETRGKDLVSCLQVLEHVPVPIYGKALDELARVADKYLLISVPFEENLAENNTQCPACGSVFNADLHLRSYGLDDIASLFSPQGFRLRDRRHVGQRLETLGMPTYERIRSLVAPRPRVFAAPSCPICGHARPPTTNRAAAPAEVELSAVRKAARDLKLAIANRLPKRPLSDYWIIALYERQR